MRPTQSQIETGNWKTSPIVYYGIWLGLRQSNLPLNPRRGRAVYWPRFRLDFLVSMIFCRYSAANQHHLVVKAHYEKPPAASGWAFNLYSRWVRDRAGIGFGWPVVFLVFYLEIDQESSISRLNPPAFPWWNASTTRIISGCPPTSSSGTRLQTVADLEQPMHANWHYGPLLHAGWIDWEKTLRINCLTVDPFHWKSPSSGALGDYWRWPGFYTKHYRLLLEKTR